MSGGVDSSVAAALLVQQGYDVVGMMMRLWSEPSQGLTRPANRCCTPDQMADARRVADLLRIPFYVVDAQDLFRRRIVQFFIDEHARARTPNPCIECNRQIRFSYLLDRALALGADYLATGHYARIRRQAGRYALLQAVDVEKDQSYVLHVLSQEVLAHALFPVGDYKKSQVRSMAARLGLLPVAHKAESMDLCFLGDGDYRRFLAEHAPEIAQPGPIVDTHGRRLGEHNGLPFYTIGQRKGLGVSAPEPLYVLRKDPATNALIVAPRSEMGTAGLTVRRVNWVDGRPPAFPASVDLKIRYKARRAPATIVGEEDGALCVRLETPVIGVTPGQGAVFYDGDVVLGGGLIASHGPVDATAQAASAPALQEATV
jgi:tRNA-specific 2-thiouridylase